MQDNIRIASISHSFLQLTLKKEKNYEVSLKLPNSFGNQYVMFDKNLSSQMG